MLLFNQQHRSLPKRVQLSNIVPQKHWSCLFKADMQRHPSSSVIIKSIHIPPETNTHTHAWASHRKQILTQPLQIQHIYVRAGLMNVLLNISHVLIAASMVTSNQFLPATLLFYFFIFQTNCCIPVVCPFTLHPSISSNSGSFATIWEISYLTELFLYWHLERRKERDGGEEWQRKIEAGDRGRPGGDEEREWKMAG